MLSAILNKIKSPLYRNTLIYTLSSAISKGMVFLMLPLVSHYLVPEQLGIAANFDVLTSIMSLLAGLAIVNGLPYFYFDRSKEEFAKLVSNLIFIFTFANLLFSGIVLVFFTSIEHYLHIGLWLQLLAVVSVVSVLLAGVNDVIYRLEDKPVSFAVLQICTTIMNLGLLLWFVIGCEMEAVGKILSVVGSNLLMAIVHIFLLVKRGYINLRIDKESINTLLKFGLPLLPHSLSFWLKSGFDKVLLTTYCGLYVNGLYSMAMSFGAMYSIFNTAFTNSYVPVLQKRLNEMTPENEDSEKKSIVRWSYKLMGGFVILFVVIVGICWLAINFCLNEKYIPSFEFVPWILLSLLIYSMYSIVIQFPYTKKKTLGLGIVTFSGAVIQLLLTFILVSTIGQNGIKISLVVGSLIISIGVWIYSNKVFPMPWFSFRK